MAGEAGKASEPDTKTLNGVSSCWGDAPSPGYKIRCSHALFLPNDNVIYNQDMPLVPSDRMLLNSALYPEMPRQRSPFARA